MDTDSEGPRHATITPDDQGALLQIAVWFMMVVTILATSSRLIFRFNARIPGYDDAVTCLAALLSVGGTIAISLAVNDGLGQRLAGLDHSQVLGIRKNIYAAVLLYLFTLGAAKISTLILVLQISLAKSHLLFVRIIGLSTGIWLIASVVAAAAGCGAPRSWDTVGGSCFDSRALWFCIGLADILTDLMLIASPVWIIWRLQLKLMRKLGIMLVFGARACVIALAITRLVYLVALSHSTDSTYDSIPYHICTQVQANATIFVICITAMKPLIDFAETGMFSVGFFGPSRGATHWKPDSYVLHSFSRRTRPDVTPNESQNISNRNKSVSSNPLEPGKASSPAEQGQGVTIRADARSLASNGSRQMFIRQTVQWDVQFDYESRDALQNDENLPGSISADSTSQEPTYGESTYEDTQVHAVSI